MDKTAIFTEAIVAIRSIKNVMTNTEKSHSQVTVLTFKNLGSNTDGESSVVFVNNNVEILPSEASVSWDWFKYMSKL